MNACPFNCSYRSDSEYATILHIEKLHSERSLSDIRREGFSSAQPTLGNNDNRTTLMSEDMWTRCTRPGCGDYILIYDIDEHLDMHAAIELAETDEEHSPPPSRRSPNRQGSRATSSMTLTQQHPQKLSRLSSSSKESTGSGGSLFHYFAGGNPPQTWAHGRPSPWASYRRIRDEPRKTPGRLGKPELGPYAFEDSMPYDVRRDLIEGSEPHRVNHIGKDGRVCRDLIFPNETAAIIPVLADLCSRERNTSAAYFCHPSTRHIHKIQCNGNFCGYWNIQVLLSYIQAVTPEGPQEIPNVLQIQSYIHQAWDRGLCAHGQIETGGIRNTRKWIGTQEALAFFARIGVKVEALAFGGEKNRPNTAVLDLLDHVEAYFISGTDTAKTYGTSAYMTTLPPIYFQRFGHSLTIIGLERLIDGSRNLLMFDSSFATSTPMKRMTEGRQSRSFPDSLLRPYRKSDLSLTRWDEFEIIVPQASIANGSAAGK